MESKWRSYYFNQSLDRLDFIINQSDLTYEEIDEIPSREKLTYSNGFYIQHCTSLFVDIRNSSSLPNKYTRPVLARIYRSYISEAVAVVNANLNCAEVNIVGDSISGVFSTPLKDDIDSVFATAFTINSMMRILNIKMKKRKIDPISYGIGIAYGRLLMIKAGYNGSGINEVVWMGDAVNRASNLCGEADSYWGYAIKMSQDFYNNLNDHNRKLCKYISNDCCTSNAGRSDMLEWESENA